jgi:hypothetical protein
MNRLLPSTDQAIYKFGDGPKKARPFLFQTPADAAACAALKHPDPQFPAS